ncbi:hypothetical protein Ddye_021581 [Dipteronia dyeriana]|uniref:Transmembrane protein n=1 Tax=Dipteronia dyeriana TaxID=168575 RepID=A0AAD9U2Q2_9ROSI|nr:hypothetical protein Ddye_021581 [Dipteronia dyeriana]
MTRGGGLATRVNERSVIKRKKTFCSLLLDLVKKKFARFVFEERENQIFSSTFHFLFSKNMIFSRFVFAIIGVDRRRYELLLNVCLDIVFLQIVLVHFYFI